MYICYATKNDAFCYEIENIRYYHLKKYKQVFLGQDAVTWIMGYLKMDSREKALRIGNRVMHAGHFSHVAQDHDLKDKFLFYRFTSHAEENKEDGDHFLVNSPASINVQERNSAVIKEMNVQIQHANNILKQTKQDLIRIESEFRRWGTVCIVNLILVSAIVIIKNEDIRFRIGILFCVVLTTLPFFELVLCRTRKLSSLLYVSDIITTKDIKKSSKSDNHDNGDDDIPSKTEDEEEKKKNSEKNLSLEMKIGATWATTYVSYNDFVENKIESALFKGKIIVLLRNSVLRDGYVCV